MVNTMSSHLSNLRFFTWTVLLLLCGCQHLDNVFSPKLPADDINSDSLTPLPSPHAADFALNTTKKSVSKHGLESLSSRSVDFATASQFLLAHSDKLLAARSALDAKRLQAEALSGLNEPMVFVSGTAGRYNAERDISTSALRDRLHNYGEKISSSPLAGKLPPELQSLLGKLPITDVLPSEIHLKKQDNFTSANVGALWPVYTGGRIDAVQQYAQGRVDTQRGEIAETKEALQTLLVKRYFLVQLAKSVVAVREKAYEAVRAHDHAAQRMLDIGLISQVERLQGATALSDARFQLEKANDDLRLAQRAFDSLLQGKNIVPVSALFVNHEPLAALELYQKKARKHHPAFQKIAAKKTQAEAVKISNDSAWKPTVLAFGTHQLSDSGKNWLIGVSARMTLNSSIDRAKMREATAATLTQIEAVQRQAESDIDLLVEKNWLAVTDAVSRYDSLAKKIRLAKEVVRLRTAGFREGVNTVIEVSDAEANLAKTRTERAKAAYDYVTSLADLLAAVGEPERFSQFISTADAHIDEQNK